MVWRVCSGTPRIVKGQWDLTEPWIKHPHTSKHITKYCRQGGDSNMMSRRGRTGTAEAAMYVRTGGFRRGASGHGIVALTGGMEPSNFTARYSTEADTGHGGRLLGEICGGRVFGRGLL